MRDWGRRSDPGALLPALHKHGVRTRHQLSFPFSFNLKKMLGLDRDVRLRVCNNRASPIRSKRQVRSSSAPISSSVSLVRRHALSPLRSSTREFSSACIIGIEVVAPQPLATNIQEKRPPPSAIYNEEQGSTNDSEQRDIGLLDEAAVLHAPTAPQSLEYLSLTDAAVTEGDSCRVPVADLQSEAEKNKASGAAEQSPPCSPDGTLGNVDETSRLRVLNLAIPEVTPQRQVRVGAIAFSPIHMALTMKSLFGEVEEEKVDTEVSLVVEALEDSTPVPAAIGSTCSTPQQCHPECKRSHDENGNQKENCSFHVSMGYRVCESDEVVDGGDDGGEYFASVADSVISLADSAPVSVDSILDDNLLEEITSADARLQVVQRIICDLLDQLLENDSPSAGSQVPSTAMEGDADATYAQVQRVTPDEGNTGSRGELSASTMRRTYSCQQSHQCPTPVQWRLPTQEEEEWPVLLCPDAPSTEDISTSIILDRLVDADETNLGCADSNERLSDEALEALEAGSDRDADVDNPSEDYSSGDIASRVTVVDTSSSSSDRTARTTSWSGGARVFCVGFLVLISSVVLFSAPWMVSKPANSCSLVIPTSGSKNEVGLSTKCEASAGNALRDSPATKSRHNYLGIPEVGVNISGDATEEMWKSARARCYSIDVIELVQVMHPETERIQAERMMAEVYCETEAASQTCGDPPVTKGTTFPRVNMKSAKITNSDMVFGPVSNIVDLSSTTSDPGRAEESDRRKMLSFQDLFLLHLAAMSFTLFAIAILFFDGRV